MRLSGEERLDADGFPASRRRFRFKAMARYVGQSSELAVDVPDGDAAAVIAGLPGLLGAEHERTYGFRAPPEEPVELVGLNMVAQGVPSEERLPDRVPPRASRVPTSRPCWFEGAGWTETRVLDRSRLAAGAITGPAIMQEYDATCLIPPGARAEVDAFGNVRVAL